MDTLLESNVKPERVNLIEEIFQLEMRAYEYFYCCMNREREDSYRNIARFVQLMIKHGEVVKFNHPSWKKFTSSYHFLELFNPGGKQKGKRHIDVSTRGDDSHLLRLLLLAGERATPLIDRLMQARLKLSTYQLEQLPEKECFWIPLLKNYFSEHAKIIARLEILLKNREPVPESFVRFIGYPLSAFDTDDKLQYQAINDFLKTEMTARKNLSVRKIEEEKARLLLLVLAQGETKDKAEGVPTGKSLSPTAAPGDSKGDSKAGEQKNISRANPFIEWFSLTNCSAIQTIIRDQVRLSLTSEGQDNYDKAWLTLQAGILLTKPRFGNNRYCNCLKILLKESNDAEFKATDPVEQRRLEILALITHYRNYTSQCDKRVSPVPVAAPMVFPLPSAPLDPSSVPAVLPAVAPSAPALPPLVAALSPPLEYPPRTAVAAEPVAALPQQSPAKKLVLE